QSHDRPSLEWEPWPSVPRHRDIRPGHAEWRMARSKRRHYREVQMGLPRRYTRASAVPCDAHDEEVASEQATIADRPARIGGSESAPAAPNSEKRERRNPRDQHPGDDQDQPDCVQRELAEREAELTGWRQADGYGRGACPPPIAVPHSLEMPPVGVVGQD